MHTTLPSNDHQEIKTELFKMAIPTISLTPYILPFHSPPISLPFHGIYVSATRYLLVEEGGFPIGS